MSRLVIILLLVAAALGCGKDEKQRGAARDDDCRESEPYAPSAMEVPLPDDFTRVADKRVGADNYRRELSRIERELAELADSDPLGDVEVGRGTSEAKR